MAVQSSHFLIRLLQSITVPQSQNLERYYDNVDMIALNLSMALKMTSAIYKGTVFNGVFYGHGNTEILFAHNDSFDPFLAHDNWQRIMPVKVLRHSRSDLGLNLPNGINTGIEDGLAIISINIPMLAVQYRAFRLNEMEVTAGDNESQRSIMQFIHMYVLPNMLESHLDYAIFNRMRNLELGIPMGQSVKDHPFFLPDYIRNVDHAQLGILDLIHKLPKDYEGTLKNIPLITKESAYDLLEIPDIPLTLQVIPTVFLASLQIFNYLARVSPAYKNQSMINKMNRLMGIYNIERLCRNFLPHDVYLDMVDEVNEMKKING